MGNLAQEITKEDMVKTYPKCKRIDIGYAKKMKYTRYAFVTFKTVADSIEAFKKTHSTQMYSKSLIVRFRRLHGTVGMPGESKPQNPPKNKENNASEDCTITNVEIPQTNLNKNKEDLVNLNLVKQEPDSSGDEEETYEVETMMNNRSSDSEIVGKIKTEIKKEPFECNDVDNCANDNLKQEFKVKKEDHDDVKSEPEECEEEEEPYISKIICSLLLLQK